jgi:hypothetical protein
MHLLVKRIQYDKYSWQRACVWRLESDHTSPRSCCFLYEWDIQARESHYSQKQWPLRLELITGQKQNVTSQPLVNPKVLLPPLHMKFTSMKVFVKTKDQTGSGFGFSTANRNFRGSVEPESKKVYLWASN